MEKDIVNILTSMVYDRSYYEIVSDFFELSAIAIRNTVDFEWLSEFNGYKDKTYIEPDFLIRNGFEKRQYDYLYCDDVEEISAQCIDKEMGVWRVSIGFLESGNNDSLDICTVGQLMMFLAICGLDNIVEEFKS